MTKSRALAAGAAAFCVFAAAPAGAQETAKRAANIPKPLSSVLDPGVITTRQAITPAGIQTVFERRVYGLAFGASSDVVVRARGRFQERSGL